VLAVVINAGEEKGEAVVKYNISNSIEVSVVVQRPTQRVQRLVTHHIEYLITLKTKRRLPFAAGLMSRCRWQLDGTCGWARVLNQMNPTQRLD
jgi:hypothetical protein